MKIIVRGKFYCDYLTKHRLKGCERNTARIILLLVKVVIQGIWIIICEKSSFIYFLHIYVDLYNLDEFC